jgi:DNA polymerase III subunit epsilon
LYAIIDIETTGSKPSYDKITEIAVVLHDGEKVVETYSTLINPERNIPLYITELTGISSEMVADAPKFYQVARRLIELTEGNIFVAHNVRFDYSFIKAEFAHLGYNFSRKTLCTVRLSRKLIPGQLSYSLGKLCQSLKIPLKNRHRALGDAEATAILFDRLLKTNSPELRAEEIVKQESKSQTLPPFLDKKIVENLPEMPGVYYFHDETGAVIYVGKSKNIRQRIIQHFGIDYKSRKAVEFKDLIHDISYELTGNELVALLLESDEIKQIRPRFNTQQKRSRAGFYGIFQHTDEEGYLNLSVETLAGSKQEPLTVLESQMKAKDFLLHKVNRYNLCEKKTGLFKGKGACFYFHLHQCLGACLGQEEPEKYNERVREAIDSFSFQQESFFIVGQGREAGEKSVVWIENGTYKGFGFLDESSQVSDFEGFRSVIKLYRHNRDIQKIICGYLKKHPSDKIIHYPAG